MEISDKNIETATFGGGCFWCTEAMFTRIDGVIKVTAGYSGGTTKNPTYKDVCSGLTGHAEVIQVQFDNSKISFSDILLIFFKTHDPTTLNRQGNDVGTQYRSVVFYHAANQKLATEKMIDSLNRSNTFSNKIVTEISPLGDFYIAENYHQNYFENNAKQPYCQFVIQPKVKKVEKEFNQFLKP